MRGAVQGFENSEARCQVTEERSKFQDMLEVSARARWCEWLRSSPCRHGVGTRSLKIAILVSALKFLLEELWDMRRTFVHFGRQ